MAARVMLLPILLQVAAPTLAPLGRQAMPARGCAAFLWNVGDRSFTAVAGADPAALRVKVDGRVIDLPRVAQAGQGWQGLAATSTFEAGGLSATLQLTVVPRDDLSNGAVVPQATLTLRRTGADELVVPLGGLVGCAAGS